MEPFRAIFHSMSAEMQDIDLSEFSAGAEGRNIFSTFVEGININTGYEYTLVFVKDHPNGPYIRIDTEKREVFLNKGTETETENALVQFASAIREKTGGYFGIHPFYGAVFGTDNSTVSEDFIPGREDRDLSMIIYLSDSRGFDPELTNMRRGLGVIINIPSPQADGLPQYWERASKANPNQANHDTATLNGLKKKWDEEFIKYNSPTQTVAMEITPETITDLVQHLQTKLGFEDVRIPRVFFSE